MEQRKREKINPDLPAFKTPAHIEAFGSSVMKLPHLYDGVIKLLSSALAK